MPRKAPVIDVDNQGSMFNVASDNAVIHAETFPSDPAEKALPHVAPVVYGEPGTYVDIATGAQHVINALTAIGKKNQRHGFGVASNTRQLNREIYDRYREAVPRVQEGAEANAEAFLQEAKQEFWAATGFTALKAAGIYPKQSMDKRANQMWREFSGKYDYPGKAQKRSAYRRTLARAIKNSQKIKAEAV